MAEEFYVVWKDRDVAEEKCDTGRADTLQVPLLQVMVDLLHTKIKRNKEPLGSQSAPERFLSVS